MAKLYFHYSTMNAGKSTSLLQASHNYREGGMVTYLITAQFDNRAGEGRIASRIGIGEPADTFAPGEDLFAKLKARFAQGPVACVFIDEAQFLSKRSGLATGPRRRRPGRAGDVLRPARRFPGQPLPRLGRPAGLGRRDARGAHDLPLRQEGHHGGPQRPRRPRADATASRW